MVRIRTLTALVPQSQRAAESLVSPPYDVVSCAEAREIIAQNAASFMRVVRPDAVVAPAVAPYDSAVYRAACDALRGLQEDRVLVRDAEPCLFVYQQEMDGRVQSGVVALSNVQDYVDGLIKKHEHTRPAKEKDRIRLTSELSANTGPVFLTYADDAAIDEVVARTIAAGLPQFDVTLDDGIAHRVWRLLGEDANAVVSQFAARVPASYIADGHHRAASAVRVGLDRKTADGDRWTGAEDYNWFLTVLFPQSQLSILAYNRIISDLNGLTEPEFLLRLQAVGMVTEMDNTPSDVPEKSGEFFVFVGAAWYKLRLRDTAATTSEPSACIADSLDCSVLQSKVLKPILGIEDPRKSERIEFAGGIRGIGYLEKSVRSGRGAVAFALHPVTVSQLMRVADRNEIMPPKSTWYVLSAC